MFKHYVQFLFSAVAKRVEQGVKLGSVVSVNQMTQFVNNHKVGELRSESHKVDVEADISRF